MRLPVILSLALLAAPPAAAGESFLDRLLGGSSQATPPNPFASNLPSAPPSADDVRAQQRERRALRGSRAAQAGPVPPERVPEE